jgi:hypothetical protein
MSRRWRPSYRSHERSRHSADHICAANILKEIGLADLYARRRSAERFGRQASVKGRRELHVVEKRISDVMGVDVLPFLAIDFREPHVTGSIEVGNPEAEWQHRWGRRAVEISMKADIGHEEIRRSALRQFACFVTFDPLHGGIAPSRLVVAVEPRLDVKINEDQPLVSGGLGKGIIKMRDQPSESLSAAAAIPLGLSQNASDGAHFRFDPVFLASFARYSSKLAMLRSTIAFVLQRKLEAGADEDVCDKELVESALKVCGVLEATEQPFLNFDVMVEQINAVSQTEIAGDDANDIGIANFAGSLDRRLLIFAVGIVPLHERVPFGERLGDFGVPPVAPQFLLHVISKEIGKRLPFVGEIDLVSNRDDLVVPGHKGDNGPAKSLLCLSDAVARAQLLKNMLEIRRGGSGLSGGRAAGAGMAFLILQATAARTGLVATDLRHVFYGPAWQLRVFAYRGRRGCLAEYRRASSIFWFSSL